MAGTAGGRTDGRCCRHGDPPWAVAPDATARHRHRWRSEHRHRSARSARRLHAISASYRQTAPHIMAHYGTPKPTILNIQYSSFDYSNTLSCSLRLMLEDTSRLVHSEISRINCFFLEIFRNFWKFFTTMDLSNNSAISYILSIFWRLSIAFLIYFSTVFFIISLPQQNDKCSVFR